MALRIEVMGPLAVRRGSSTVPIPGRRTRLVLSILAADPGTTVPVSRVVDALWEPEEEPLDPTNTVQQYVAQLRRALTPPGTTDGPSLVTSPPGYRLDAAPGQLDLVDLDILAGRARAELEEGDADAAVATATRTLDLWQGVPFQEFADHPFLVPVGESLAERRLILLEVLVVAAQRLGDHALVLEHLDARPEFWAGRHELATAIVVARSMTGRTADALAAAEEHRLAVAARGLELPPAFRRLVEEVSVHGRPSVDAGPAPIPRSGTATLLRDILLSAPADPSAPPDHLLAVVSGLNDPAMSSDVDLWLGEMARHDPLVRGLIEKTVGDPTPAEADLALRLALQIVRYWDWTGRQDHIRRHLGALVGLSQNRPEASEAAGWLAYSLAADHPPAAEAYLGSARDAAGDDPHAVGRVAAVEAVVRRDLDPAAALARGEAAARLLAIHGTAAEAAYAHVVSALAALDAGDRVAAEHHAHAGEDLGRVAADRRLLAWVDVILSRLTGDPANHAAWFGAAHDEQTTLDLLAANDT